MRRASSLDEFPNELLFIVFEHLKGPDLGALFDINAFLCTNQHLANLLDDAFYEFAASRDREAPNEQTSALHLAIRSRCEVAVVRLLEYGSSIEKCDEEWRTPMLLCLLVNDPSIFKHVFKRLMRIANDPTLRFGLYPHGLYPVSGLMFRAAQFGCDPAIMHCLFDHGISPDEYKLGAGTPLYIAARNGHFEIAALLLDHGATVASRSPPHPSNAVAKRGICELFHKLLARTKVPRNILNQAVLEVNVDAVKAAVQAQNFPWPCPPLLTQALCLAVLSNSISMVQLLLKLGVDPDYFDPRDEIGRGPLSLAAEAGQVDVAVLLLRYGASVDMVYDIHVQPTPLFWAKRNGHLEMEFLLLQHGAKIPHNPGWWN